MHRSSLVLLHHRQWCAWEMDKFQNYIQMLVKEWRLLTTKWGPGMGGWFDVSIFVEPPLGAPIYIIPPSGPPTVVCMASCASPHCCCPRHCSSRGLCLPRHQSTFSSFSYRYHIYSINSIWCLYANIKIVFIRMPFKWISTIYDYVQQHDNTLGLMYSCSY